MISLRFAQNNEIKSVKELWKYSFSDDDNFIQYYFDKRYDISNNIVAYENGVLASLQKNPYSIIISNDMQLTSYIVGISVYPEHRGKKLTSLLIEKALQEAYYIGEKISLLMPIDTNIYRRYGYENCFNLFQYDIDLNYIEFKKNNDIKIERITNMTEIFVKEIELIYNEMSLTWDVFLRRDESYYYRIFDEVKLEGGNIFIARDNENNPVGYMIFYPNYKSSKGFVREIFCLKVNAWDALLNIIASHKTQFQSLIIHQSINSNFLFYENYNNKIDVSFKPFMMARIVNAKEVLKQVTADLSINLKIKIDDKILANNNKMFHIVNSEVIEIDADIEANIIVDIGTLTQLYLGVQSVKNAIYLNKISIKGISLELLDRLFPIKTSYINEYI